MAKADLAKRPRATECAFAKRANASYVREMPDSPATNQSDARFRAVLRLTNDWYWEQDTEFRFTLVIRPEREPPAWASAVLNRRRWELGFDNLTPEQWNAHRAVVEARQPFRDLVLSRTAEDGERFWFSVSGEPMYDEGGAFKGYRGVGRNITDKRRAEEALRQSEHRFQTFMDNAPAVAWIKDSALRYTYLSAPYERMFCRPPTQLLGRDDLGGGWPEETARILRRNDLEVLQSGAAQQVIESAMHVDGKIHHWLSFKFPLADSAGKPGVAGMAIDITERIDAEEQIRRYSDEVRELCASVVNTREEERRRIADDLHDLIGQNLTALGLELAAMKTAAPRQVLDEHSDRMRTIESLLNNTIDSIRGVMSELRPPALEEYGLVPAVHWYGSDYGLRTGIKVSVLAAEGRRLARQLEIDLFRVVQEALTNVAKHSQARSVEIAIQMQESRVAVRVSDDGIGFAHPSGARAARRGGWGLPSMRERAEAHGGILRVEFPQRGTRLVVEVPASYAD